MIKTVGIVSLSSGVLGEPFIRHELELGVRRLQEMGLKVKFMEHTLAGAAYLKEHPEARAADWLQAYEDDEVDLKQWVRIIWEQVVFPWRLRKAT